MLNFINSLPLRSSHTNITEGFKTLTTNICLSRDTGLITGGFFSTHKFCQTHKKIPRSGYSKCWLKVWFLSSYSFFCPLIILFQQSQCRWRPSPFVIYSTIWAGVPLANLRCIPGIWKSHLLLYFNLLSIPVLLVLSSHLQPLQEFKLTPFFS